MLCTSEYLRRFLFLNFSSISGIDQVQHQCVVKFLERSWPTCLQDCFNFRSKSERWSFASQMRQLGFHTEIIFSDEDHFSLNGFVNRKPAISGLKTNLVYISCLASHRTLLFFKNVVTVNNTQNRSRWLDSLARIGCPRFVVWYVVLTRRCYLSYCQSNNWLSPANFLNSSSNTLNFFL